MDPIQISLKDNRRGKKTNSKGEKTISLRVYKNKKEFRWFPTGVTLDPKYWDSNKEVVKRSHPMSVELNLKLSKLKIKHEIFVGKMNRRFDKFDFSYYKYFNEESSSTENLVTYMETVIERRKKNDSKFKDSTYLSHINKQKNLKEFNETILFSNLNVRILEDFEGWMRNTKGYKQNTITNHFKVIKVYVRKAISEKLITEEDNPFNHYSFSWEKVKVDFLTPIELQKIEKYKPLNDTMKYVKDVLLFSCYTGLAYADYSKISFEEISFNKGEYYITSTRKKTGSDINIPVSNLFIDDQGVSKPEKILKEYIEKYIEFESIEKSKRRFFPMSNQKLNENLKTLANLCGINKNITTHMGRHTFGTLMCNDLRVPITIVQQLMSHSKIDQTVKYVVVNSKVIKTMLNETEWNKFY